MNITMERSGIDNILEAYTYVSGKGIADLVRANARLCAVELANRTQPFTTGSAGDRLKRGTEIIGRDLSRVIKTKDTVLAMAEKLRDEKLKKRVIKAVAGNPDKLADLLVITKIIHNASDLHILSGEDSVKTEHRKYRKNNGHTYSPPGKFYLAKTGFAPYLKTLCSRIGLAKSGWAQCARQIGGVKGDGARGIPAFAKRQKKSLGFAKPCGGPGNPGFIMTNTCSHLNDRVLPQWAIDKSEEIAMNMLIQSILKAIEHCKKGKAAVIQSVLGSVERIAA